VPSLYLGALGKLFNIAFLEPFLFPERTLGTRKPREDTGNKETQRGTGMQEDSTLRHLPAQQQIALHAHKASAQQILAANGQEAVV